MVVVVVDDDDRFLYSTILRSRADQLRSHVTTELSPTPK